MNDQPLSSRVDLNLFRVFAEIYRAESLTQAAARLRLTQPAVSNALSRLRAELADPLFVREGRRMLPTPLAREMAPRIVAALEALEGTRPREQPGFAPFSSERRYTIGMRTGLESLLLAQVVKELEKTAPRVSLHSVRYERRKLARMLSMGALDLAVDVLLPVPEEIRQRTLFVEEVCVAARIGHPLLAARDVPLEGWLRARHIAVSARPRGPTIEDVVLERLGLVRNIAVRCQHYYTACLLLAETDLVLMLPRHYAEHFQAHLSFEVAAPPTVFPQLEIAMYWHARTEQEPGLAWLIEQITRLRDGRLGSLRGSGTRR